MAKRKYGSAYRTFNVANHILLIFVALSCVLPLIYILAVSFSNQIAVSLGQVSFWPVGFNTDAYVFLLRYDAFWKAMGVSVQRIVLGGLVNMVLTVLTAYPLSKDKEMLSGRTIYAWYFIFTMLFGGGLIPTFLVVKYTGLIDSIWSLIIPGALPVFNVVLLLNFFRQLPKELEEAAFIDGAGNLRVLFNIYLPVSLPALATIALFAIVGHWNEWFSAIIYMRRAEHYPVQTFLQSVLQTTNYRVRNQGDVDLLNKLSNKTVSSAQIFIGMVPILCVYPFLQKYFAKGIVLGSVKG